MIKIGMVGLDSSHCVAFAEILNKPEGKYYLQGGNVTAAYPGGSDRFHMSRNRVGELTRKIAVDYGIKIKEDIPSLVEEVDAVFLLSVDGRQHLEQFEKIAVGKPVFIDKPLATCVEDAKRIVEIAHKTHTPIMSCSSLRFADGVSNLITTDEKLLGSEAFGPAQIYDDYPGLFWYGIHTAEILFSYMGMGCKSVICHSVPGMDVLVGQWPDYRIGVMRGLRLEDHYYFGCLLHTDKGVRYGLASDDPPYYYRLLQEVMRFLETGISPIEIDETLEIISFIQSADQSKLDGKQYPIRI